MKTFGSSRKWAFLAILIILPTLGLAYTPGVQAPPEPILAPASLFTAQELANSDNVAALEGVFKVSESGAATYTIAVDLPQGVAGVTPSVSLSYSSTGGNGVMGLGWTLSAYSAVVRCRQTLFHDNQAMPIRFNAEDRFCLNGQRLVLVDNSLAYGSIGAVYKLENDNQAVIRSIGGSIGEPDRFEVESRDGSVSVYGASGAASTVNSEQGGRYTSGKESDDAIRWALSEFRDSVGNKIGYSYFDDADGFAIKEINYAYGPGGSNAKVEFSYFTRSDATTTYIGGWSQTLNRKLHKISVKNKVNASMELLHYYLISYKDTDGANKLSRVEQIDQCYANGNCAAQTDFQWNSSHLATITPQPVAHYPIDRSSREFSTGHKLADINGDGRMDIIWRLVGLSSSHSLDNQAWDYVLSDDPQSPGETSYSEIKRAILRGENHGDPWPWAMIDYNLDGRSDLAMFDGGRGRWIVYVTKYNPESDSWEISHQEEHTDITEGQVLFQDVNGDGAVDAIGLHYQSQTIKTYLLSPDANAASTSNVPYKYVFTSESIAYTPTPDWQTERFSILSSGMDFNGDGQADYVYEVKEFMISCERRGCVRADEKTRTFMSIGDKDKDGREDIVMEISDGSPDANYISPSFVDLNHDGYAELVALEERSDGAVWWFYRENTGNGFLPPVYFYRINHSRQAVIDSEISARIQFVDLNKDGYTDLLWQDMHNNQIKAQYWEIDKAKFADENNTRVIIASQGENGDLFNWVDTNGDGVLDLIYFDRSGDNDLYIYHGTTTAGPANTIRSITTNLDTRTDITYQTMSATHHYLYRDITKRDASGNIWNRCNYSFPRALCDEYLTESQNEFYQALNGDFSVPDGHHTLGKDGNEDGIKDPVLPLNGPMYIVTQVSSSAPAGDKALVTGSGVVHAGQPQQVDVSATSKVSYYYVDSRVQAMGRGMLGFGALLTVDEQSKVRTTTRYRQDFPFVGYPYSTTVETEEGDFLKVSSNEWRMHNWDGGSYGKKYYQPFLYRSVESSYELWSALPNKTVVTQNEEDPSGYANIPKISVVTSSEHDPAVYKTVTTNAYYDGVYNRQKSRLKSSTVQHLRDENGDGVFEEQIQRSSSFKYILSGNLKGLLLEEIVEPGTIYESKKTYKYDSAGNKIGSSVTAKDPETGEEQSRCVIAGNIVTTALYDSNKRYIVENRDCLNRKVRKVVARNKFGGEEEVEHFLDATGNQKRSSYKYYTAAGVQYMKADHTGAFSATTLSLCGSNNCPAGTSYYKRTWGPGNDVNTIERVELAREYADVLGRTIRSATRGFSGEWIFQDTEYDSLGRVQRRSTPYKEGDSPSGWSVQVYDTLGRVVAQRKPDGSVSTVEYLPLRVTRKNALGQTKIETVTLLGESASVIDNLGGQISYSYDAQGNLKETRHNSGTATSGDDVVISINYDTLGRKTDMDDPDKGYWRYSYNAFGELKKQVNARGQSTHFTYDALGRQLSRTDMLAGGQVESRTQWSYDGLDSSGNQIASYSLGKVSSVYDEVSGYAKVYAYDAFGRVSTTVTSLGVNGKYGDHFEKTTYDQYGRVFQVFDAARNSENFNSNGIEQRYNDYGHHFQTVDAVYHSSGTRKVYHTILEVNARGQVVREQFGNGVERNQSYYAQTGMIKNITALSATGKKIQDLEHNWDAAGNLNYRKDYGKGATNTNRNVSLNHEYDGLNRLTRSVWKNGGATTGTQEMRYNALGNIVYKSGVGNYEYSQTCNCGPHAVTKAGSTHYQYDANGNMVRDSNGRKIAYTVFDKPYYIEMGSSIVTFSYDSSRSRYLRVDEDADGSKITLYISGVEKITHKDGSLEWKRYLGNGLIINQTVNEAGSVSASYDRYSLTDNLGSMQYLLDSGGLVVHSMSFDPWGARRQVYQNEGSKPWAVDVYSILETTRGYTGHEMVDGFDIVHMNGRIYDSRLGRFLQADIIIDGVSNTQGYNRYSYGKNNPLNGIDPSGFGFFKEVFDDFLGFTENPTLSAAATIAVCATPVVNMVGCAGAAAFFSSSTTYAATGDVGAALKAGVISGVSALAFSEIGSAFGEGGAATTSLTRAGWSGSQIGAAHIGSHALTGGVLSVLQGGKFGHGFASAGLTKGFMKYAGIGINTHRNWYHVTGRVAIASVVGGTISDATGGKFANGAVTAAFAHLLNAERSAAQRNRQAQMVGPKPFPGEVVNFAAGWGDSASFGATRAIREVVNVDGGVNMGAAGYRSGLVLGAVNIALTAGGLTLQGTQSATWAARFLTAESIAGNINISESNYGLANDIAVGTVAEAMTRFTPGGNIPAAIITTYGTITSAMYTE